MHIVYRVTKAPGATSSWDARRILPLVEALTHSPKHPGYGLVYCTATQEEAGFWGDLAGVDGPIYQVIATRVFEIRRIGGEGRFKLFDAREVKGEFGTREDYVEEECDLWGGCEPREFVALVPLDAAEWELTGQVVEEIREYSYD